MGTYVNAYLAFGVTVEEPEWDINAEYVEPDEDAEELDLYELTDQFPPLDYGYAGDSNWDENPSIIYVKSSEISAYHPVVPVALREIPDVTDAERSALAACIDALPPDKRVSEPGWLLFWSRG